MAKCSTCKRTLAPNGFCLGCGQFPVSVPPRPVPGKWPASIPDVDGREPRVEAELIVRLEEILENDYELTDLTKLQEDMKTLAYGVLLVLRREEMPFYGKAHCYDSFYRCMSCGRHRSEIEGTPGNIKICTGGV